MFFIEFSASRMLASRRGPVSEEQENANSSIPGWQRASSVPAHKRPVVVSTRNAGKYFIFYFLVISH